MSELKNFVGREKQKEIFRSKYLELCEMAPDEEKVFMLSYYGIGGIGKTWLKEELKRMAGEDQGETHKYIEVAIEENADWLEILRKIAGKLYHKYGYEFPRFILAYNVLMDKAGERYKSINFESEKESRTKFDSIKEFLPDSLKKTLSALEFSTMLIKSRKKFKNEEKEMLSLDFEELKEKITEYFSDDINDNYDVGDRPLTVFIDTYENLVSEVKNLGDPLSFDRQLRSKNGIFKRIKNVMWVICGREELRWETLDKGWEGNILQTPLRELSLEESDKYLALSGVEDEEIRKKIYDLTGGLPLYLFVCVKLINEGNGFDISTFSGSTEELFSRFIKGMSPETQDVFYLLCAIGKWSDDDVDTITAKYSDTVYETIKKLSFVEKTDGVYTMNRTVSNIITKRCPETISKRAGEFLLETYRAGICEKDFDSPDFAWRISSVLRGMILISGKNRNGFAMLYKSEIQEILHRFTAEKYHSMDFALFTPFLDYAKKEKDDLLYGYATWFEAYYLSLAGRNKGAAESIKEAAEVLKIHLDGKNPDILDVNALKAKILESEGETEEVKVILEENGKSLKERIENGEFLSARELNSNIDTVISLLRYDGFIEYAGKVYEKTDTENPNDDTLDFMHNYAYYLHNCGFYREALPIKTAVYEKRKEKSENHRYTLYALLSLADTLTKTARVDEAILKYNEAIEKLTENLGAENPATLTARGNLGYALCLSGRTKEALGEIDALLEISKEIFGENHPETLNTMHNKSVCHYWDGDMEKAYQTAATVYEKRKIFLGKEHPDTSETLSILSVIMSKIKKDTSLIAKQQEVIKRFGGFYGENNIKTLTAMQYLGQICENIGEYDKGYVYMKEALAKYTEVFGKLNPLTQNIATGMLTMFVHRNIKIPPALIKKEVARVSKEYKLK